MSLVRCPDELPRLREAVLAALLGLTGQQVAFGDLEDADGYLIDIGVRNEQLLMQRASIAAAVVDCCVLECLLAYRWEESAHFPLLVNFLHELLLARELPRYSGFLTRLAESACTLAEQLEAQKHLFWQLVAERAVRSSRGFVRSCAGLAATVQPSQEQRDMFVARCAGGDGSGGIASLPADLGTVAALVVFAANAGCLPGDNEVLTSALDSLELGSRMQLAERIRHWPGPVRSGVLDAWATWLAVGSVAAPAASDTLESSLGELRPPPPPPLPHDSVAAAGTALPMEPGYAGLRELVHDAPVEYRCGLDGRLLVDPVRLPSGCAVERAVLVRALRRNGGRCPLSGAALDIWQCARDTQLRKEVSSWIRASRPRCQR
eukprot:TRINITY_DN30924_c0_g1_i3.p1 TRINITY_DN30924_c0_g1~~TRINITY_DN30924_c0_g1_i3.p1  ORF type:complete len:377 (+),score=61.89 TRINITY_DN30924_c0_g1_i3:199-1329(+)